MRRLIFKDMKNQNKQLRGFATLSQKRRKEIARMGGIAAHKSGNANQFTKETGSAAGKIGGRSRRKK